jgi:hypothetical protein
VHVLPAPSSQAASPFDFRDTSRLIDEGYRLASNWLATRMMSVGTGTQSDGVAYALLADQAGAFVAPG